MTPSVRQAPEDPHVSALLVCHRVYHDAHADLYALIGVGERIRPHLEPLTGGNGIGIYAVLTNMRGRYSITARLLDAGDECEHGEFRSLPDIDADDPLQPWVIAMNSNPASLPPPGKYVLQLFANGRHLTGLVFWIEPWNGNAGPLQDAT